VPLCTYTKIYNVAKKKNEYIMTQQILPMGMPTKEPKKTPFWGSAPESGHHMEQKGQQHHHGCCSCQHPWGCRPLRSA